ADQQIRIDWLKRPADLAQADPMTAACKGLEVFLPRSITKSVDDHVGAVTEMLLHSIGKTIIFCNDNVLATEFAREPCFVFA
ncbi:MAG: hypothetical protein EBX59_12600, partial [Betaproteobacteria bacterium]|nr:hypothetical protein [Betaproteobacteria bacterium]